MERLNTSWELLASPPGRGDAKLGLPTTHHQHPNPNQRPSFPTTMNTRTDNAVVRVWGNLGLHHRDQVLTRSASSRAASANSLSFCGYTQQWDM